MAATPAVLKERDAGAFASRWAAAANCGMGFSKSWNRFRTNRCTVPCHQRFLEHAGLILLTKIDADSAAV